MTEDQSPTWPFWKKAAAYLALSALAAASIWLVDRKVHNPPPDDPQTSAVVHSP
jgi:hypothetical protein